MSTVKVANIQHPDAANPAITLAGDGSLTLPSSFAAISDLSDVDTTGAADGDALVFDGTAGEWIAVADGGLGALSDVEVELETITAGDGLVYDGDDWVNQPVMVAVEHGANASVVRPAAVAVYWKGSVEPNNAIDGDVWYDTSS